jgi:hypothetical protein
VTFDDIPNVYRTLVILPIMLTIISVGITEGFENFRRTSRRGSRIVGLILIGIALYEAGYFTHQYVVHAEKHQPWHRDFAMKALVTALGRQAPKFNKIMLTKMNTSYIHILFFDKIDPRFYQASGSQMDKDNTGFGNYIFIPEECPLRFDKTLGKVTGQPKLLYVNNSVCDIPPGAHVLTTIYWGDGNPAFRLLEYTGK